MTVESVAEDPDEKEDTDEEEEKDEMKLIDHWFDYWWLLVLIAIGAGIAILALTSRKRGKDDSSSEEDG